MARMSSDSREVSIHALMRVRRFTLGGKPFGVSFNPRTHESATDESCGCFDVRRVSIHALMRVRLNPMLPGFKTK